MKKTLTTLAAVLLALTSAAARTFASALLSASASSQASAAAQGGYARLYEDLPIALEQPALPDIPGLRVSIADFGAVGDGIVLNTEAFTKAVSHLKAQGGGHLDVPAGIWLTGPIELESHIDLHLQRGALLVFSPDKRLYFEGEVEGRAKPCISAQKCTDISITGEGIIDGNGKYWRYAKREKLSDTEWKDLLKLGGTVSEDGKLWFPTGLKGFQDLTDDPEKEEAVRQHLIIIKRCQRVLISGVTVQNSPKFHINPSQCTDVVIDGVTVRCPWNAQNGDGIDIGNSRRVLVTGCSVDVGDDGICMKGGSGENGLKAGVCSDILIAGNTVFHGHGGFVIGSDFSGGMERIVVKDCVFSGTDIGLRFKSAMDRGGKCADIYISDIVMNDIRDAAVSFLCDYENVTYKAEAAAGKPEFAPDFSGITMDNILCHECQTAIEARGIAGLDCIHDISISTSLFYYKDNDVEIDTATADISLDGVRFVPSRPLLRDARQ